MMCRLRRADAHGLRGAMNDDAVAAPAALRRFAVDEAYGGLYAGTSLEFSGPVADHLNATAAAATGVLPYEFVPFAPGVHVSVACPTVPLARPSFIADYARLRVTFDGSFAVVLRDHPHLFSAHPEDPELLRGVPTYIPTSILPDGFVGRSHSVELFLDEERIFGPAERFFHTPTSGALFNQIEDAPGGLVLEVRGDLAVLARRGEVVFFTDPAFGEPATVVQLEEGGAAIPLDWRLLGRDRVGSATLFNEWVAVGVQPRSERLVIEVRLPRAGTGLAAALFSGHTRDTAFRVDATVL
jgi:hypothetical protein